MPRNKLHALQAVNADTLNTRIKFTRYAYHGDAAQLRQWHVRGGGEYSKEDEPKITSGSIWSSGQAMAKREILGKRTSCYGLWTRVRDPRQITIAHGNQTRVRVLIQRLYDGRVALEWENGPELRRG
jgi:hypothetical protein